MREEGKFLKKFIFLGLLLLLIATNAFSSYEPTILDEKSLGYLSIGVAKGHKPTIGDIYVYSSCDYYFTLTQFVEPDLLLYTWIYGDSAQCWGFQRLLTGRRIFIRINKEKFQQGRRMRGIVNVDTLASISSLILGKSKFKIVGVTTIEMSDGTLIKVAIIESMKE